MFLCECSVLQKSFMQTQNVNQSQGEQHTTAVEHEIIPIFVLVLILIPSGTGLTKERQDKSHQDNFYPVKIMTSVSRH